MSKQKENPEQKYIRRMVRILYVIEYLGRFCQKCGFDGFEEPWFMDFHHKNKSTKKYMVKNKLYSGNFITHKEEIDKCELICGKCHRQEHSKITKYSEHKNQIMVKLEELKSISDGTGTFYHQLTDEEKKTIIENLKSGLTMHEISEKFVIAYHNISNFVRQQQFSFKINSSRIRIDKRQVIRYLNSGYTLETIASKFEVNRETIRKYIIKNIKIDEYNGVKVYGVRKRTNKSIPHSKS